MLKTIFFIIKKSSENTTPLGRWFNVGSKLVINDINKFKETSKEKRHDLKSKQKDPFSQFNR